MIHTDKSALICDLAETYGIYDYGLLPASKVAILSCGLRENSRIKMKINGTMVPDDILLLAHAVDRLSILIWQNTKDGAKGRNKPYSIAEAMLKIASSGNKFKPSVFNSPEEFEERRKEILERK